MTTRVWTFNNPELPAGPEDLVIVQTLDELLYQDGELEFIQRGLADEWGQPDDMKKMRHMAENAGQMTYVFRFPKNGTLAGPAVVLRTKRADVDGNPQELIKQHPTFDSLISETWKESKPVRGNTVLLLDITTLIERNGGYGSKARDTGLYMQPESVIYGLPLTPADDRFDPTIFNTPVYDKSILPPAVRFHLNGGAEFVEYRRGYKERDLQHGTNVVFTRYRRDKGGIWVGVRRPYEVTNFNYRPLVRT